MRVFGSFGVGMRVFVLEMFMLVAGVRMRVRQLVVSVFVGVRCVITVLMVCHCQLLIAGIPGMAHCALHDDAMWTSLRLFPAAPGV
jgi:hypothetical protein